MKDMMNEELVIGDMQEPVAKNVYMCCTPNIWQLSC